MISSEIRRRLMNTALMRSSCGTKSFLRSDGRDLSSATSVSDIVNLDQYPLHCFNSTDPSQSSGKKEADRILENGKASLQSKGYLLLPDFLSKNGLEVMQQETLMLFGTKNLPFRSTEDHNVSLYEEKGDSDLPVQRSSKWLVAADQLPVGSSFSHLYDAPWLLEFMSSVVGKRYYQSVDPMNRIHLNQFDAGDGLGWHHDNSEFFFNLLLQQPVEGGVFEFVHDSYKDPNVVRAVAMGSREKVQEQPKELQAGSALLFLGSRSMHRVTPVRGDVPRLTGILNFSSIPGGGIIEEYTRKKFFGRSLQK